MTWIEYITLIAAPNSKGNAAHWFRYLRKDIDREISKEQLDELYNNQALTAFQRVTIKAAYTEGSSTRKHIMNLNKKIIPTKLSIVRKKHEN